MKTIDNVQCHRVDQHRDMYPEFAPEPIVIRCTSEAKVVWTDDDAEGDDMVLCAEHALEQITWALSAGRWYHVHTLSPYDKEQYLAGWHYANEQALTYDAALIACHEDYASAGLWPPEYSGEPFTLGWEWNMGHRVSELVEGTEAERRARDEHEFEQGWNWDKDVK